MSNVGCAQNSMNEELCSGSYGLPVNEYILTVNEYVLHVDESGSTIKEYGLISRGDNPLL